MPGSVRENSDKIINLDLSDYWMIIRKRAFDVVFIFILVLLCSIWFTLRQTPVYQAESKIKIAARQPMATIEGAQITWYGGGQSTSIKSEIELIQNKDAISELVLDMLQNGGKSRLFADNEKYFTAQESAYIRSLKFKPELHEYIEKLNAASLKSRLIAESLDPSDILVIRIRDGRKDVAEALANLYAMAYKADFWKSKTIDAEETKKFIEEQLNSLKAELENREKQLMKSSEQKAFLGSEEIYRDEISRLKIELQRLLENYQPEHPRVQKLTNLIAAIEKELAKIPHVKHEYDDNMADWELKQSMRKSLGEYHLKAEIDYKAKKEKTKDEVQIISQAAPGSAVKIKPNNIVNILAGSAFGLILALAFAFIWEGLDTSIGKIEDVERITQLPVIGHIPLISPSGQEALSATLARPYRLTAKIFDRLFGRGDDDRPINIYENLIFNFPPLSAEAEAYRTLRANIQFTLGGAKASVGSVIAVTSTSPREGKTLTSTNFALALAQLGKNTLLIEADMRRPKLNEIFKLPKKKDGLSELLIGTASQEDAICGSSDLLMSGIEWEKLTSTTGIDNFHFICSGTIPPNPSELLMTADFASLIHDLREKYDFIIIDTPPVLPVADSSIIGSAADGVVMVYQSDKTSRHLLLRAIDLLQKNKVKLLGIVINQLAFDVVIHSSRYGYEYYTSNRGGSGKNGRSILGAWISGWKSIFRRRSQANIAKDNKE